MMENTEEMNHVWKANIHGNMQHKQETKVQGCNSRVRLGGVGSYLEVRLGQWQQENG